MNREILFRGLTKDGEWVQGYFFQTWEKTYMLWGTTNGAPNMIEVLPATVGQYTGLKDKNGKMIFEGDKFTAFGGDAYDVVVFRDGAFGYVPGIIGFVSFAQNHHFKWEDGASEHIEVI